MIGTSPGPRRPVRRLPVPVAPRAATPERRGSNSRTPSGKHPLREAGRPAAARRPGRTTRPAPAGRPHGPGGWLQQHCRLPGTTHCVPRPVAACGFATQPTHRRAMTTKVESGELGPRPAVGRRSGRPAPTAWAASMSAMVQPVAVDWQAIWKRARVATAGRPARMARAGRTAPAGDHRQQGATANRLTTGVAKAVA